MQIPIQSGVRVKDGAFEPSYPINLEHRVMESGLSKGQLVSSRGAATALTGPGRDRGGTVYRDRLFRVMGSKLVEVAHDNTLTVRGDVGDDGAPVGFAQSFDRLAIRSAEKLFYWDGTTFTAVSDGDLGRVLDVDWLGGYFVTVDGENLVVTELLDPQQVDPLKYGSAEADPDALVGVKSHREEIYAFGRYSIQVFRNVGGRGFPFQNVPYATVPYGCISADAKTRIGNSLAFVGGARDEPIGVFILAQGNAIRVSDDTIDDYLATASNIQLESRTFGKEQQLLVHTDDRTLTLSASASQEIGDGVWSIAHSGNFARYRPRKAVFCYGRQYVGDSDSSELGTLTEDNADHFGAVSRWQFDAGLLFDKGAGLIAHEVEIHGQFPTDPSAIFLSMTRDGRRWSGEVARQVSRDRRAVWRPNVKLGKIGGFRFRGTGRVSIARCDVAGEALAV